MYTVFVFSSDNKIVRKSQNLRAIVTHNQFVGVDKCTVYELPNREAIVNVLWTNVDECHVKFADYTVAKSWASKNKGVKYGNSLTFVSWEDRDE
jgi:hypothetical protein